MSPFETHKEEFDTIGFNADVAPATAGRQDTGNTSLADILAALTAGAIDGAIRDGVTSSIKATVHDYANSNPLAVVLRDTNGDYVSVGGGTQYTEDAAAPANPVGNAMIVVREDARAGSLVSLDGDNVALRGNNLGELYVKQTDSIAVTGTFYQATQPVSAASLPLPSGAATAANQATLIAKDFATQTTLAALLAELQLKADLTETQPVSLASVPSHAVTNAGTFAVQESGGALTALQIMDDWDNGASDGASVSGDVAHDAADAGEPVKVGYKAVLFDGSAPPAAAVAENDRVNGIGDEYGRQYVNDVHPNYWEVSADYSAAQTNASIKVAPGAGLSLYITDISISNGATAGNITLLNGSGGAVKYEIYPAINGGAVDNRRTPIKLSANTALLITSTTVTTHSVNISGFIAP